ncbi:hypothetical protein [Streptomyces sp. NPDC055189]
MKPVNRCVAVIVSAAAVTVLAVSASPASAEAAADGGGNYAAILNDSCGDTEGIYGWTYRGKGGVKPYYDTYWDFSVRDTCADNRAVSLYTKYNKWTGTRWVPYTASYHRLPADGLGSNVADVRIFLCKVGLASTCVEIWEW